MKMRMSNGFRMVVVAAGLMAGCVAGFAQSDGSSAGQPLQVNSRLVVVDVVVMDRNGNFVSNLDRSKFHVSEDKVPQAIRNFDPPTGHEMPAGSEGKILVNSSADLPKIGKAPVNVLVIDELNTPYMQIAYSQQMMTKYLKTLPEVLPVPTLFIAAGASRIQVLHDFTQSRADLLASVKTHVTDADFTTLANTLNGGRHGNQNGMVQTLGALEQVATSMRGFPGRKNVIWVGTGYKRSGDMNTLSPLDEKRVMDALATVTNRMLASHITLYTIDPEGVRNPTGQNEAAPSGSPLDGGDNADTSVSVRMDLEGIADATGGRVMFGRNDIDVQVARMAQEGREYYTLAYVPASSGNASKDYRKIKVTVDDPSLRVISRNGYFGTRETVAAVAANTEKQQPKQLKFDLLSAARTTLVYTGLHTNAARTKDGYSLQVTAKDLHWETQGDGSRQSEVTVVAVCYDVKGKELGQHAAELKEVIEATDQIEGGAKVGFAFPMASPVKTARIRFVVRDADTGTMGSVDAAP
jgi:VWFA-related protein